MSDDFDLPPHKGYWPDAPFAINATYTDGLTTSWRTLSNDSVQIRRNAQTLFIKQDGVIVSYDLAPDVYADVAVYLATEKS